MAGQGIRDDFVLQKQTAPDGGGKPGDVGMAWSNEVACGAVARCLRQKPLPACEGIRATGGKGTIHCKLAAPGHAPEGDEEGEREEDEKSHHRHQHGDETGDEEPVGAMRGFSTAAIILE